MPATNYTPGDFYRICDVCGFKCRASQTKKRWDGLITCEADWEPRHPQDFVRGRADNQNVPEPRPDPVMAFIGPLLTELTAAASAGATSLTVSSTVRFGDSDFIGVFLNDGSVQRIEVSDVPSATGLTLAAGLAGAASIGNKVINYSAVAEADVG